MLARRVHRVFPALAALVSIALLLLALAPSASAHAVLESSTPSSGQVLASGLAARTVELVFDEPVVIRTGCVQVLAADGHRVDFARASHPRGDGRRVAVAVRDNLAAGTYLVLWRVVSADSHPVSGSFTFSIGHVGSVARASGSQNSTAVAVMLVSSRLLSYVGVLGLVGGLVFLYWCWPAGTEARRGRRLLTVAGVAAAVSAVVSVGVQAADDTGAGLGAAFDVASVRALLATQFGHAHLARLGLLLGLAAAARRPGRPGPLRLLATAVMSVGLLGTVAAEGHAGASGLLSVMMTVDVLHLAAAACWLGGLAMLLGAAIPAARAAAMVTAAVPAAVLVGAGSPAVGPAGPAAATRRGVPGPPDRVGSAPAMTSAVRRFSAIALSCVTVLVVSGVVQAWRQVGELGALTGTAYGRLLLAKVALLLVILAAAAFSRAAVHSRLVRSEPRLVVLSRTVLIELVVAVLVLAVTSVLVGSTPARVAYRPAESVTVHAGPDTIQLSAVPVGTRMVELHLYVFAPDGLPAEVQKLQVSAQPVNGSLGPVTIVLSNAGTGHFVAGRVLLPSIGHWRLQLSLQVSEFDEYPATTTLTIR